MGVVGVGAAAVILDPPAGMVAAMSALPRLRQGMPWILITFRSPTSALCSVLSEPTVMPTQRIAAGARIRGWVAESPEHRVAAWEQVILPPSGDDPVEVIPEPQPGEPWLLVAFSHRFSAIAGVTICQEGLLPPLVAIAVKLLEKEADLQLEAALVAQAVQEQGGGDLARPSAAQVHALARGRR